MKGLVAEKLDGFELKPVKFKRNKMHLNFPMKRKEGGFKSSLEKEENG